MFSLFAGVTLCFGGGVLLATVLLHMLKEVREVLEQAAGKGALPESLEEYPFAELMVGAGINFPRQSIFFSNPFLCWVDILLKM